MKTYLNYIRLFLLVSSFFILGNCYPISEEISSEIISLSESEWYINYEDNAEYANAQFSHQNWQTRVRRRGYVMSRFIIVPTEIVTLPSVASTNR